MAQLQGFWSYVHADDEAEGERISRLARDVSEQFEMLTGEPLDLFLDRDAIRWGEDWHNSIDSSLASVAFFIPVMTPRYFMSPECRREMQFFVRRATSLGIKELVLPLLYVDVPSLHNQTTADDLIKLARTYQWEDWRELRFADPASEGYRRGIARLAERLVEANRQMEKANPITGAAQLQVDTPSNEIEDDSPGFIDRVAKAEEALPSLTQTLTAISQDIDSIGQISQEVTADMGRGEKQGQGFAARLLAARRLARELVEPTERIWVFSNEFASQFHDVDEGFRAIIERAPLEIQENPNSKANICDFFGTVRHLSERAHAGLSSVQKMIDAITPLEAIARDLRPVLRRLRQGLTTLVEAREVSDEWIQLINNSGIVCEEPLTITN